MKVYTIGSYDTSTAYEQVRAYRESIWNNRGGAGTAMRATREHSRKTVQKSGQKVARTAEEVTMEGLDKKVAQTTETLMTAAESAKGNFADLLH